MLINWYAAINEYILLYIITYIFDDTISLITGPILVIYVKSLFIDNKKLIRHNLYHFIFPVLYLLVIGIPMLLYDIFNIEIFSYAKQLYELKSALEDFYLIFYGIYLLKIFNNYNKVSKSVYSNFGDQDVIWVKHLFKGVIILSCVSILTSLGSFYYQKFELILNLPLTTLIVIYLYYLSYKGIKQSRILLPHFLIENKKQPTANTLNLDTAEVEQHIQNIKATIVNDKLFLDEDLTLTSLADKVNLSDKKLSAIINHKMNTTFYDLINTYRIEEFKKRIISEEFENLSIFGIATDCGFKSKSTFNRLFKLKEGVTPSIFKKNSGK